MSSPWSPSNETIRRKPSPNGDEYEWILLANPLLQNGSLGTHLKEIDLLDLEYKVTLPVYNNNIKVIILNIL